MTPGALSFDKPFVEKKTKPAQNQKFKYADAAAAAGAAAAGVSGTSKEHIPDHSAHDAAADAAEKTAAAPAGQR